MISQLSLDNTGWALFSNDMTMRYRLARCLNPQVVPQMHHYNDAPFGDDLGRVVFLMLNPSTADAFKPDPTVTECRKRAIALGADVLEVVNLFALRSPYPEDLRKAAPGARGDDHVNDAAIITACCGARMIIAAWGNGGDLDDRAARVVHLLSLANIRMHHLGRTSSGAPKHPLARGKHRIPADLTPIAWENAVS
jgi:hypothetical protein